MKSERKNPGVCKGQKEGKSLLRSRKWTLAQGVRWDPKGSQVTRGLIVYTRELQFYSKSIGKPLKDFMQWSDKQLDVYL